MSVCDCVPGEPLLAAHRPLLYHVPPGAQVCNNVTTCHRELLCVCVRDVHKYAFFVCATDNFTDSAVSGKINGEHKEKDLEPWDGGETHNSDSLESLDTDVVREKRWNLLMWHL